MKRCLTAIFLACMLLLSFTLLSSPHASASSQHGSSSSRVLPYTGGYWSTCKPYSVSYNKSTTALNAICKNKNGVWVKTTPDLFLDLYIGNDHGTLSSANYESEYEDSCPTSYVSQTNGNLYATCYTGNGDQTDNTSFILNNHVANRDGQLVWEF